MAAAALHDMLSAAVRRLREGGIDAAGAAADVEVLARHVLGWNRAQLLAHRLDAAPPAFAETFDPLVERRARDLVPVAYLTGTREFYGLDFVVTPDVLIPRPETELLVDAALGCLDAPPRQAARIVDVGTGSGCIAVAIAVSRPETRIVAIDRSRAALAIARRNAAHHDVSGRVHFAAADLLSAVASGGLVDTVVSNPPYVPDASLDVAPDVRRHEPSQALFAGRDGLDVIRRLIAGAGRVLRPGGYLLMEIGIGQADAVAEHALDADTWTVEPFRLDLQGIPRVAVLQRRA